MLTIIELLAVLNIIKDSEACPGCCAECVRDANLFRYHMCERMVRTLGGDDVPLDTMMVLWGD